MNEVKRYEIKLESEARLELEKQLKLHTTEYRLAERAKIILLSADGMSMEAIAYLFLPKSVARLTGIYPLHEPFCDRRILDRR